MAKFNLIAAAMEATLRAEGNTRLSTAKPNADQIDEFAGRFKIAAFANGSVFNPPDNVAAWTAYCPVAVQLIVGRGSALEPWRQFELAIAGAGSDPARQSEVIAKYRARLGIAPIAKDLTKARALLAELGRELG